MASAITCGGRWIKRTTSSISWCKGGATSHVAAPKPRVRGVVSPNDRTEQQPEAEHDLNHASPHDLTSFSQRQPFGFVRGFAPKDVPQEAFVMRMSPDPLQVAQRCPHFV